MSGKRVPTSTYRLQMHAGFSLADAAGITDYLHALGVSHAYTSSILAAKPGSTHGYDVVDHGRLNPEIGTEEQLREWIGALRDRGMGWVLDVVPNHMSVGGPNEWWADVLEHGPASPFASHFDIAWNDHPRERLHGKVLLPILGRPFGAEVEAGAFRVAFEAGAFVLRLHDQPLPVDPRTYGFLLGPALESLRGMFQGDDADVVELASIVSAVGHLPPRAAPDPSAVAECRNIKRRLGELAARRGDIAAVIAAVAEDVSGSTEDPGSFARLEELLDAQAYRPCFWRVASDEINYRRFFDVNDLAALSTEREEVFAAVHRTVGRWLTEGLLDGLRIDHPDGLYDPKEYLDRLQALAGRPLYVAVEKILGEGEALPAGWQTDGTTGYEFINLVNGLFVDADSEAQLSDIYQRATGFDEPFEELVYHSKFHLLQSSLASELHILAHQLDRLAQAARWSRDFTLNGLRHALREVIACFPVYRSYVNGGVSEKDRALILRAVVRAKRRNPLLGRPVFDFVRDTLLLKDPPSGPATPEHRSAQRRFVGKFQQVTSPAMAKGFEDTALYVHARLISLNEVGGEPTHFGRSPERVHQAFRERAESWRGAMSPLSTHDTKRSEDMRARIDALSEMPDEWASRVDRWMRFNARHKVDLGDGRAALDANEEYFLYQTLVGVWPPEGLTAENHGSLLARIQAYLNKALHEAKVNTSWINPDADYDAAASTFVERLLAPGDNEFLGDFEPFQRHVARIGLHNSLSQTLLRLLAPGVPDTYQGTELWDFSLVDPDNRRPVDYALRTSLLRDIDAARASDPLGLADSLTADMADGRIKLFLTAVGLRLRRDRAAVFAEGTYEPVIATGPRAGHVFCFVWRHAASDILVVAPRLFGRLLTGGSTVDWADTRLPLTGKWRNHLTGETHSGEGFEVADLLRHFPVGLLESVN